ncbi:hypothetical protein PPSIR1_04968 [Plesiocystis pacifica SIR-1]|uniref:Thioredoxin domain-containing protein n=1 Tax=Plesiocystis pacifica SIR-1 TaxID=391625 RepID=A6FWW6_9BACT|nr:hypothetical protein [Plesiocystis pacifica]EDM81790.1 hypothetical protein PPSIR1_04968 [Plesiocystis pacifica SIR-1]
MSSPTTDRRRSTLLIAAMLLGPLACDEGEAPMSSAAAASEQAEGEAKLGPEPADTGAKVAAKAGDGHSHAGPAAAEPEARSVASGLDVGQRLLPFDIINASSGKRYCQICEYGPFPVIMAVGTVDDPEFRKDIVALEAVVDKFGSDKIRAFAVLAESAEGEGLITPHADREALMAQAKAMREELGVRMPVVVPAPNDGKVRGTFEDHYRVSQSRTIMFADRRKQVKFSAIAPLDLSALEAAISDALS